MFTLQSQNNLKLLYLSTTAIQNTETVNIVTYFQVLRLFQMFIDWFYKPCSYCSYKLLLQPCKSCVTPVLSGVSSKITELKVSSSHFMKWQKNRCLRLLLCFTSDLSESWLVLRFIVPVSSFLSDAVIILPPRSLWHVHFPLQQRRRVKISLEAEPSPHRETLLP